MKCVSTYKEWNDGTSETFEPEMLKGDYVIERLEYHEPVGEGDVHYVDVIMSEGTQRRIFRPDEVILEEE